MKNLFFQLISVLLIAGLLCPATMAEEFLEQEFISSENILSADVKSDAEGSDEEGEAIESTTTVEIVPAAQDSSDGSSDEYNDIESSELMSQAVDEIVTEIEALDLESDASEDGVNEEPVEEEYTLDFMEAQNTVDALNTVDEQISAEAQFFDEDTSNFLMAGSSSIGVNSSNFPDDGFRQYVSEYIDKNPHDGYLSDSEIAKVEKIDLTGEGFGPRGDRGYDINNLNGIEIFYNLDYLNCYWCSLTSLDVSQNTNLVFLDCAMNALTSLNIGQNSRLQVLKCWGNNISTLDITGFTKILSYINSENKRVGTYNGDTYTEYIGDDDFRYHDDLVGGQPTPYLSCDNNTTLKTEKDSAGTTNDSSSNSSTGTGTSTRTGTGSSTSTMRSSVSTISVPKSITRTVNAGNTYQIDLNGAVGTKFKSSKRKVATVTSSGLIYANAEGKTRISFKVGKKRRTLTLKVVDPTIPTSISLNMSGTNSVNQGDTVTLVATLPSGTNSGIKWKSNHNSVATVSNGVVTFKKKGSVTITATTTRGKKKAKVKFKVSKYDSKKDLSNYDWRVVTGVSSDKRLVFQKTHKGGYMSNHRFKNGDPIFVNLTWREGGDAIAYEDGTYGYVPAKYIEW